MPGGSRPAKTTNDDTYAAATDVYLSGGPQNLEARGLPDGDYYFQVADPSGHTLPSSDDAVCRQPTVVDRRVAGPRASTPTTPPTRAAVPAGAACAVRRDAEPERRVQGLGDPGRPGDDVADPKELIFSRSDSKTDNFK